MILLLVSIVHPNDKDLRLESSIYYTIFKEITHSDRPKIYMYESIPSIKKFDSQFQLVKDCSDSDIVILRHIEKLREECRGKMLFGTRYQTLDSQSVIGAFFWQKGRPNILFYKTRLDQHNITLDKHFEKYIDYEK